jgi:polar amino acid transport system substrate-binding protein
MNSNRMVSLVIFALLLLFFHSVNALECGEKYEVAPGDSLSQIADEAYGDRGRWDIIFYSNRPIIGSNPSKLHVGQPLWIPCLKKGENVDADNKDIKRTGKEIKILTAGDYAPFTDEKLPK